ncbi:MAG: hypothetical protein H6742_12115 [Alphaproteobacteria bacterium]|nr:hypothetical protein [Alphaproteobacteria bacterium]
MLLLLLIPSALGACPEPLYQGDLQAAMDLAEDIRSSGEPAAFEAAMRDVESMLDCVVEPVGPELALDLHRLQGWKRQAAGQSTDAVPYLAAGEWQPAEDDDGPLAKAVHDWAPSSGASLPPPVRGRMLLDGQSVDLRPSPAEPYLFQRLVGDRVTTTAYVHPGERPPRYPRLRRRLVVAGSVGVGLTAGLLVAADQERRQLTRDRAVPYTQDELDAVQARNHGLLIGATATGALTGVSFGVLGLSYLW